jgi:hypothetical protein
MTIKRMVEDVIRSRLKDEALMCYKKHNVFKIANSVQST